MDDKYSLGRQLTFFRHREHVLAVTAEPPSWVLINEAAAEALRSFPVHRLVALPDLVCRIRYVCGVGESDAVSFANSLIESNTLIPAHVKPDQQPSLVRAGGLYIELTSACNLSCKHCYVDAQRHGTNGLHPDTIENLMSQLEQPSDIGVSGGEPLLRDDSMEIVRLIRSAGHRCSLLTNGLLVNSRIARELSGLDVVVQVSLESHQSAVHDMLRGEGTFELAVRAIQTLLASGCRVRTSFVPTRPNALDFPDFVEFCADLGVSMIHACTFTNQGRGGQNVEFLGMSEPDIKQFQLTVDALSEQFNIVGGLSQMLDVDRAGCHWDRCPPRGESSHRC